MISSLKTEEGYLYGYIEWYVMDNNGQFKDNGDSVFVNDVWVHPSHRRSDALRELISMIDEHKFTQNAQYVYWLRHKYDDRMSVWSRTQAAKKGINHGK